jgi:hypothetical protein
VLHNQGDIDARTPAVRSTPVSSLYSFAAFVRSASVS